jgi:menaquinone-specific isochorismate synthase
MPLFTLGQQPEASPSPSDERMSSIEQDAATEHLNEQVCHELLHALRTEAPHTWQSQTHLFVRISCPYTDFTPLELVELLSASQKTYWRDRNGTVETCGIGIAHSFETSANETSSVIIRSVHDATRLAPANVRYYGGMRFHAHSTPDAMWSGFAKARFILPFLECERTETSSYLHCTVALPCGSTLNAALHLMREQLTALAQTAYTNAETFPSDDFTFRPIPTKTRINTPTEARWMRNIAAALQAFDDEVLEKVVLARRVTLECSETLDAITLFKRRVRFAQRATAFLIQFDNNATFFGTTPEFLFRREGRTITTEAVAGTRRRGKNAKEDVAIEQELLSSDKDRREHASVQRYIASALDELTETFSIGTVELLKLSHLQHLYAAFTGRLRANIDDAAILEQLHPTPAVGGTPRREALDFLQHNEGFDRGWYAAPIGWLNAHAAEFVVGIRSALVRGNTAHLFSGAGIVTGSEAEAEWNEIEMKIAPLLDIFTLESA